jgi:hypothetical protein
LAQGDRRNFCIVDQAGTAHSLARRIEGVKAKDVNERLADIDRDKLPTVDAARDTQREKHPTKEAALEAWRNRAGAADYAKQQEREAEPEPQPEQRAKTERHREAKPEARHPGYAPEPEKAAPQRPLNQTINDIRETWKQSPDCMAFAAAMHDQGYRLAKVTAEEARQSERAAASARCSGAQ